MIALLLAASLTLSTTAAAPERRFALVVGENVGDPADEPLRYALEDARRFASVMKEVGGLSQSDSVVLLGASASQLESALRALEARLADGSGENRQLLVYVSSHAAEGELHLHGSRFPISKIVEFLKRAPVAVGLLVIDSCQSGEAIRIKGLKPSPGPVVGVELPSVTGRAIITSSGASESAQESERLRGSYFTHHLVMGLRGAADQSGDGRVTLQEAYGYAYTRTVESTFATRGGVQRPGYALDLKGTGELVLTWPAKSAGQVSLEGPGIEDWLILSSSGELVGQVARPPPKVAVAIAPGSYVVKARSSAGIRETRVVVSSGTEVAVHAHDMPAEPLALATGKGAAAPASRLLAGLALGSGVVTGVAPMAGIDLALWRAVGFGPFEQVVAGSGLRLGHASGSVRFRHLELDLTLEAGKRWKTGPICLDLGLEPGVTAVWQDQLPEEEVRLGVEPRLGLFTRVAWGAWKTSPYLSARAGTSVVRGVEGRAVRGFFLLGAGADFTL